MNLITLILSLMVFYGLIVIFLLAMAVHWYDRLSNAHEFAEHESDLEAMINMHEFATSDELSKIEKQNLMRHAGHLHYMTPFDFSEVQISVWIAVLPATVFIW